MEERKGSPMLKMLAFTAGCFWIGTHYLNIEMMGASTFWLIGWGCRSYAVVHERRRMVDSIGPDLQKLESYSQQLFDTCKQLIAVKDAQIKHLEQRLEEMVMACED